MWNDVQDTQWEGKELTLYSRGIEDWDVKRGQYSVLFRDMEASAKNWPRAKMFTSREGKWW